MRLPPLPARPKDAHKASVGRVLVVGGSRGMAGAPSLAARGALRAGAGLVVVAVPQCLQDVVAGFLAEAMTLALPCDGKGGLVPESVSALSDAIEKADAVVVGPGAGRTPETISAIRALVASCAKPVVLDADGLFAFAGDVKALAARSAPVVVTPHEGEAASLLGLARGEGPVDRRAWADRIAREGRAVCVLKGPGTIVSDGTRAFVNRTGGPVLATGGSGDVLSGAIAALVAGLPATGGDVVGAVRLAVHVHGLAGDLLARRRGDRGVLAGDVADALPDAIRTLRRVGTKR